MSIAYDSSNFGIFTDQVSTTDTISVTVSGSDRILFAASSRFAATPKAVTGMTYNGTAMTFISSNTGTSTYAIDLYYLIAPSTGTNNLVVTYENANYTTRTSVAAASYTGAKQSGQPDSNAKGNSSSTSSLTTTTTVVGSSCWLVIAATGQRNNLAGGTGTTLRTNTADTVSAWILDSNGTVGTGSQSLIVTQSAAGAMATCLVSFLPLSSGGATTSRFLTSLYCG